MADSGTIDLLFAHEDGGAFLSDSADPVSAIAEVARVEQEDEKYLADISANANELDKQRWALVVADGPEGDRLSSLVNALVAKRAEDQQAEVMTVRVPAGMTAEQAMAWKKDVFPGFYNHKEHRRPRYLCILGDMDQVSSATQQVLSIDGFPGRLVCKTDDGYQAYADKVVRWEQRPSEQERARSLFYTVHDGTGSTVSGYDKLVRPCIAHCQEIWETERHEFPATAIEDCGSKDEPDPSEFLGLLEAGDPTVLFSLSHGMGPPRRRRWTPEQARERQGAMVFGTEGAIMPSDIAETTFLPGGLWFYFACFGAGTPSESAYHHWLNMLNESGMEGLGNLQAVLKGLSQEGGFTSGLAQAALANPNGPLGLLGHVDLAWSYSYEELQVDGDKRVKGTNRASSYFDLLAKLVKGERLGISTLNLQRNLTTVSTEINQRYDRCKSRGVDPEGADEVEKMALGNLWMQRQDLTGYVILGDPAVRLPLADRKSGGRRARRAGFQAGVGSMSRRRRDRDAGGGGQVSAENVEQAEKAILEIATGQSSASDAASALGVGRRQVRDWEQRYREAGRRALAEAMSETD